MLIICLMQVTIRRHYPMPDAVCRSLAGQAFTIPQIVRLAAASHIVSKKEGLKIESRSTT
jgi:hypothetical protein